MKNYNELVNVKNNITKDFNDPIIDNSLVNFISGSSKMIRSDLAISYLKAYNIELNNDIYNILSAGEIIHNASLLHDDVIDNAKTRRGITTISEKFGAKISILAGDYLLSYAIEKLLSLNNNRILYLFKDCTKEMAEAEIIQYFFRDKLPSLEEYIKICERKTAILFSTILESCAICSNLNSNEAKDLGLKFGIYFQIKNDLNKESAFIDKLNGISTIKEILGIEKTNSLLDNYSQDMKILLKNLPNNIYRESIEELFDNL